MTRRANYRLPVIEVLLVRQGAKHMFTILGLKKAFHKQPLEGDREDFLSNHNEDLRRVLEVLKAKKLVVDQKCDLFVREVEFCGQVLSNGTRRPMPGRCMAIEKWQTPRNVTELRGFLGFTNYYAVYLPGYAEWAARLQEKLKVPKGARQKGQSTSDQMGRGGPKGIRGHQTFAL